MGTTVEKLTKVLEIKESIKNAINSKGGTLTESNKFSDYVTAINNLASGGGSVELLKTVIVKGDTPPVPNTGYIEKIFFNTKLTTDEVDSIIASANLNFISGDGMVFYPILSTDTISIVILDLSSILGIESGSSWIIGDIRSEGNFYYTSPALADLAAGIAGWNESLFTSFDTGEVVIGANLQETLNGIGVGSQNNLLNNLVSSNVFAQTEKTEVAKNLTNQYKIVEENIILDTAVNSSYSYDFVNSINEETKEITVIKNIEVDTQEEAILDKSLTTYTNNKAKTIGAYIFYNSEYLTDVNFPKALSIGSHAFSLCQKLVNVNIPKVTDLADYAFSSCKSLVNINFPKVTNIADYAFSNCSSLVNINFPQVTNIGTHAFSNCSSLVDINLPQVNTISTYAFVDCTSLINITLPLLKTISSSAFHRCCYLINATFPEARTVAPDAFYDNYRLTEVILPKANNISREAFYNCYSLVKIFISQKDTVCKLNPSNYFFENCYHIWGTTDSTYNPNGLKDGYFYVPASLLSQYKVDKNWKSCSSQIIGHEDLEAGVTLPNYTTSSFTTQTWYSDEKLTTVVTSVATSGTYYCKLEA